MTRRRRCRWVKGLPQVKYFKPRGIPFSNLEEINLNYEEYEAIRLSDVLGMEQDEACRKMNISRQTYGRVLISARKKIAQAIVVGKALCIQGGVNNWTDNQEIKIVKSEEVRCHAWKKWNGSLGSRTWNW